MIGILGNSLSITILSGSNMRNSTFNVLLIVLIIFDNTFIIFAMLDYACVRGGWNTYNFLTEYSQNVIMTFLLYLSIISVFLANTSRQQSLRPPVSQAALPSQQHHHLLLHWLNIGHQYWKVEGLEARLRLAGFRTKNLIDKFCLSSYRIPNPKKL